MTSNNESIDYTSQTEISIEDFLLYHKYAFFRENIDAILQLHDRYPKTAQLAFEEDLIERLSDPADKEAMFQYPIVIDSDRMTEQRVLNVITYLVPKSKKMKKYKAILRTKIKYCQVFNYFQMRYIKDYNKSALWNDLFLKMPELRSRIRNLSIKSFEELIYHACEYFEKTKA